MTMPPQVELDKALKAIADWQNNLSDQTYADILDKDLSERTRRFKQQQGLLSAAENSADEYLTVVAQQTGITDLPKLLARLPVLATKTPPPALANPNWQTDSTIHAEITAAGGARDMAYNYCWWHLVTLRQIKDRLYQDPPGYLATSQANSAAPYQSTTLDESVFGNVSEDELKKLDTGIRNLFRNSGGIFHRRSRHLQDCPLSAAWWKVEMATACAADPSVSLTKKEIYEALNAAWREWSDRAIMRSPRLVHPRMIAAYALAAQHYSQANNAKLPKGTEAAALLDRLMRRTLGVSVPLVEPHVLAELAE